MKLAIGFCNKCGAYLWLSELPQKQEAEIYDLCSNCIDVLFEFVRHISNKLEKEQAVYDWLNNNKK
ncbi:MAG TPA: hypothetical protein ENH82_03295 [bacterium]|nr:hypothetical protein [bacterium]